MVPPPWFLKMLIIMKTLTLLVALQSRGEIFFVLGFVVTSIRSCEFLRRMVVVLVG